MLRRLAARVPGGSVRLTSAALRCATSAALRCAVAARKRGVVDAIFRAYCRGEDIGDVALFWGKDRLEFVSDMMHHGRIVCKGLDWCPEPAGARL
eukprot:gene51304-43529_t